MKKNIVAILASFILFTSMVFAIEPGDVLLHYGGNIEEGDMLAEVSLGFPSGMLNAVNTGGWGVPEILGEFEYAYPVIYAPFTFGGYLGLNFRGYPEGFYDGTWYPQNSFVKTDSNFHFIMRFGGLAAYHVDLQIENFDINLALNLGLNLDISKVYPNGIYGEFDWGIALRGIYFIQNGIGIKFSIGYPSIGAGVVFSL